MSGYNSISPFTDPTLVQLLETMGLTQFVSETNWYHTISGLLIQGGYITNAATGTVITFNVGFTKQVLGVFIVPVNAAATDNYVSGLTINTFAVNFSGAGTRSFYWFAVGV